MAASDPQHWPFSCDHCDAVGELPLAEGDAYCPLCDQYLWTVRPESPADTSTELRPARLLPVQSGRPPLSHKGLRRAKLCVLVFRPFVCLWAMLRQRTMTTRVNDKLAEIAKCCRRDELEKILGPPLYAVGGENAGLLRPDGSRESPDLIECYESDGCCIDLWFKDDRLVDTSGFIKPTVWDMVLTQHLDADSGPK